MPDPIQFSSTTPRFGIPHLFAAQAQKEFIVNEAHALTDMLLHASVEGEADSPPPSPVAGECWLVGSDPTGEWAGHPMEIAGFYSSVWLFASAGDGMRIFDRASGQMLLLNSGIWQRPAAPESPIGGTTVDGEARAAIVSLIETLRNAGVFSAEL